MQARHMKRHIHGGRETDYKMNMRHLSRKSSNSDRRQEAAALLPQPSAQQCAQPSTPCRALPGGQVAGQIELLPTIFPVPSVSSSS